MSKISKILKSGCFQVVWASGWFLQLPAKHLCPYLRAWDNMNCATAISLPWQSHYEPENHSTAHMDSRGEWKIHSIFLLLYDKMRQYRRRTVSNLGFTMNFNGSRWGACSSSSKQPCTKSSWDEATLIQSDISVAVKQHPKNKANIMHLPR